MAQSIAFLSFTFQIVSSTAFQLQARSVAERVRSPSLHREELENVGNAMYTGSVNVGGQTLRCILDTGSFELLVLSTECEVCGDVSHLYDQDSSKHYEEGDRSTQHSFGSGVTFSKEAFDKVRIGNMVSERQHFWRVVDAMMPILGESQFAAIVGVGPPDSVEKMEQPLPGNEQVLALSSALAPHKSGHHGGNGSAVDGSNASPDDATVDASLSVQIGMDTFSVCIRRQDGSHGVFVWNDVHPAKRGGMFVHVPVAGEIHWAGEMFNVRVGRGKHSVETLGCSRGCAAVIDSGTSLIVAPEDAIMHLNFALAKLREDCSNLDDMPDLVFTLGGQTFSLPPDAYIGRVVEKNKSSRHILRGRFRSKTYRCVPLVMSMDADTQLGPLWILGLPFFRKYYTTFSFDASEKPVRKQLSMALADSDCQPIATNERMLGNRLPMNPVDVDLSQIVVAPWVKEAMVQRHVRV